MKARGQYSKFNIGFWIQNIPFMLSTVNGKFRLGKILSKIIISSSKISFPFLSLIHVDWSIFHHSIVISSHSVSSWNPSIHTVDSTRLRSMVGLENHQSPLYLYQGKCFSIHSLMWSKSIAETSHHPRTGNTQIHIFWSSHSDCSWVAYTGSLKLFFMQNYLENRIFDSSARRLTSHWSIFPPAVLHQRECFESPRRTISAYPAGQLWAKDTRTPCFSGERFGNCFCTIGSFSFTISASIRSACFAVIFFPQG